MSAAEHPTKLSPGPCPYHEDACTVATYGENAIWHTRASCGARGPRQQNKELAVWAWNNAWSRLASRREQPEVQARPLPHSMDIRTLYPAPKEEA